MENRKRRRFTAEDKAEAVKRLEESGKPLQAVADELGVHANQLRGWRNERLAGRSGRGPAPPKAGTERVARLMREGGLTAGRRRRVPRTTDSRHDDPVAPNLLERRFAAERPDAVWLADLSYIPTGEGWLYLAAIKDLATREIVGWSMADHPRAELACDALRMALQRRQPPPGLIHHSDRGVQYACKDYRAILARHGLVQSMSRKGDCWDNAPMESFFGSLKTELVHRTDFPTREAARRAIFEYLEAFYNRRRRHSGLGFLTPAQAYEQMAEAA